MKIESAGIYYNLFTNNVGLQVQVRNPHLRTSLQVPRTTATGDRRQLIQYREQLVSLRKALVKVDRLLRGSQSETTRSSRAASVRSSSSLGFARATSAVLQSTEEVNTTPTSFSPRGPDWSSSTAQATIGGVYDGSNGTGTLTFDVQNGGTHGRKDLKIKVFDPGGTPIDLININKKDPIDKQYELSNGLVLTLGEGDLIKNDTFTVDVYDTVGSSVDPDKPFNGIRNDNPNLEEGLQVTAGSFQLNGTTIDIYADDTLNTVLSRITQSDAGVSATFNAAAETVVLTQKTPGSAHTIVLENDSSGFLESMKLDGATCSWPRRGPG